MYIMNHTSVGSLFILSLPVLSRLLLFSLCTSKDLILKVDACYNLLKFSSK